MTHRDDLRMPIFEKITHELGRPRLYLLRYSEVFYAETSIGDRSVQVIVKKHPSGENPEFYQGRESWTVEIFDNTHFDEDPELIFRLLDAQESLELALQMVDWDKVRASLHEG